MTKTLANTIDGSDEKQAAYRELISIFLQLNPEPADEQVHSLAAALAVDKESLESIFYEMLGEAENGDEGSGMEAFTIEAATRMHAMGIPVAAGVAYIAPSGGQGDVGISQDQKVQDGDYDENEIPVDDVTINDGELSMDDPDTGFQEETYDDSTLDGNDLANIDTKDLMMNDGVRLIGRFNMSATPYLSNLGLSNQQIARKPDHSSFPMMFNPATRNLWNQVIDAYESTAKFTDANSISNEWYKVINEFIDLCGKSSIYPFTEYHQSFNDQSVDKLRDARRAVVKFMNRSKILDLITVRNTHRKAVMTETGFALIVSGEVKIKGPTFPEWILQMPFPRFDIQRDINGRWIKKLTDNATFFVENEHAMAEQRWVIGYEIKVDFFPEIPNKHIPSKAELERFILDVLWMPVLKSMRPFGLSHKLL